LQRGIPAVGRLYRFEVHLDLRVASVGTRDEARGPSRRSRVGRADPDQVTLELPEEQYKPFEDGVVPGPLLLEMPISVDIFGTEIPLGRLIGELPANEVKVALAERIADADPPQWLVRLEPATEGARNRVMRFERKP
jgi:hypothetical protein